MQSTLAQDVSLAGIGLHTGAPVKVTLKPAPVNAGRVFVRTDLSGHPQVPAKLVHVASTTRATSLVHQGASVDTVEHLLAAMAALGVDNALIELDGPELPALDGSALPWLTCLDQAGITEQAARRIPLCPSQALEVTDGDRLIRLEPDQGLWLDVEVDFSHPKVGRQRLKLAITEQTFRDELAWARTFGFEGELDALRSLGLIQGGSLDNAVVYGKDEVLNKEGLRAQDEPVRHKTLDLLGDLALLGRPLHGRITAKRPGHALAVALLSALIKDQREQPLV